MEFITLNINLSKIDKSKIYRGTNGNYISICVAKKNNLEYENTHIAFLSQTKEEREKKEKKVYIGYGKEFNMGNNIQVKNQSSPEDEDTLPF